MPKLFSRVAVLLLMLPVLLSPPRNAAPASAPALEQCCICKRVVIEGAPAWACPCGEGIEGGDDCFINAQGCANIGLCP